MRQDPSGSRKCGQQEKIEHHEQVVGDNGGRDQVFARFRCICHSDQIDRAADIGADKHCQRLL